MLRKNIKLMWLMVVLISISMLFIGCSQKKADSLDRINKAGSISFAMSGGYPPFNYYNDENELVGFDVDVCKEVAKRLDVEFEPITTEWSGIIEGLRSGAYDGILGSMAVTEDREEVVDFSTPYYYSGAQLVVQKDSIFQNPEDVKGKVIGVVTGTTFEKDAQDLGAGEVKLYKDDNQTLLELNSGVVDAVITDRVVGVNALNNERFTIRLLGNPLRSENIAVAFRQDDTSLKDKVNEILEEMHNDGTLTQLSKKWLNVDITKK